MRHRVAGKQLSRSTSHRRATRRNMAAALFQHGAIRTTETKAKELRRFVEKLITQAKKGTLHARRLVIRELGDQRMYDEEGEMLEQTVVQKLFGELAPRYADRPGGYTRLIRLSDRRIGDAGQQVLLQLVEETPAEAAAPSSTSRRQRRAAKRHSAARGARKRRTGAVTGAAPEPDAEAASAEGAESAEAGAQDEPAATDSAEKAADEQDAADDKQ
ncbi:MAG: 50S ribosomal protein L17 [Phycisphaerae bacterium]|nr:50S ribosomal protein L17 [Phycisphaerae bacterium]